MDCSPPCSSVHEIFHCKNTGVGLPCPPPGHHPNPRIERRSPALQMDSSLSEPPEKPYDAPRSPQLPSPLSPLGLGDGQLWSAQVTTLSLGLPNSASNFVKGPFNSTLLHPPSPGGMPTNTDKIFPGVELTTEELDVSEQKTRLLVAPESCPQGSDPKPLFSSVSTQCSLPPVAAGLLFPNTIKKRVWKGPAQVLANTGKIYYYACFPLTWKRNSRRRRMCL